MVEVIGCPDHLYPALHLRPERGWINDPNGPIHWRGQYHLFYQENPMEPRWGRIQWGHAVSGDLVHWQQSPPALVPTSGGPDEAGCWSGSTLATKEGLTIVYTGVREDPSHDPVPVQTVCIASSTDGERWVKHAANPLLAAPEGTGAFRDPFLWHADDGLHLFIGAGTRDGGGRVLHYAGGGLGDLERQPDLLAEDDWACPAWARGSAWECPQLVPVGAEHALLVSVCDEAGPRAQAVIQGRYDGGRLIPRFVDHFDLGPDFYAAATMRTPDGRTLCWGWSWEARSEEAQVEAGWAGVLTFPRVLGSDAAGRMTISPTAELERLRSDRIVLDARDVSGTELIEKIDGTRLELRASFDHPASPTGVAVRTAPDGSEVTLLYVDPATGEFVVDRTRSSCDASTRRDVTRRPFELADGEPLELTVYVDGSLVEAFVNGRAQVTARTYPTSPESNLIGFYAEGRARLRAANAWNLAAEPAIAQ